jgi:hypothetical protein
MDERTTIFLLALAVITGAFALWQGSRKRPFGQVALFPWTGLLFTAIVGALFLLVHLLALAGLQVGQLPIP